jgi:hypothetical protein
MELALTNRTLTAREAEAIGRLPRVVNGMLLPDASIRGHANQNTTRARTAPARHGSWPEFSLFDQTVSRAQTLRGNPK